MLLDKVPLLEEGLCVAIGFVTELEVEEGEDVESFGLDPPDLVGIEGSAESFAFIVEATMLFVPAPFEGMVDELSCDAPRFWVSVGMEFFCGFDEEVGGFNIVSEGVVRGSRSPILGEEEAKDAGIDGDAIADDGEDFFESLAHDRTVIDFGEFAEGFEEVDVGVHRLVAEVDTKRIGSFPHGALAGEVEHGLIGGGQLFAVAAVGGIVRELFEPIEGLACEFARSGILAGFVVGDGGVDGESDTVNVFDTLVTFSRLIGLGDGPEQATLFGIGERL